MSHFIFKQLDFARKSTLRVVEGLDEQTADIIPAGFNNNIRWHLGHIYTIQEQLSFHFAKEPLVLPADFKALFGNGTKPADWQVTPPSVAELVSMLTEQTERIRVTLENRLADKATYKIGSLEFESVGELISFSMYHEGMHVTSIKDYKRLLG